MKKNIQDHVYVFGHQNPDTDSICSAIAYAHLKRQLGMDAAPYRLGKINKETAFVLEKANMAEPEYLSDIKVKLRDLELFRPISLKDSDPIYRAWAELISLEQEGARLVPVTTDEGYLKGLLSLEDITKTFMISPTEKLASENEIIFSNLVNVLGGEIFAGAYPYETVQGAFYVGSDEPEGFELTDKDIVITGAKENLEKYSKEAVCGCIIVTNNVDVTGFEDVGPAIIVVDSTIVRVVSTLFQAISVSSVMKKDDFILFEESMNTEDTFETMRNSSHRAFPVVTTDGRLNGIISRRNLMEPHAKNVILVDHNENKQSAIGIEKSNILEIVDHHRIADVQTDTPLYIRAEPVGCTATIVTKMYDENHIVIPKNMAMIMLGAIVSDTLLFSSPTCTKEDKRAAEKLSRIAGVHAKDFGEAMFKASTSVAEFTSEEILAMDRKRFSFGSVDVAISQINVMNFDEIETRQADILEEMQAYARNANCEIVLLMITHIEKGGSTILFAGDSKNLAKSIFGAESGKNEIFLPGILSRKKQIVPKLHQAIH